MAGKKRPLIEVIPLDENGEWNLDELANAYSNGLLWDVELPEHIRQELEPVGPDVLLSHATNALATEMLARHAEKRQRSKGLNNHNQSRQDRAEAEYARYRATAAQFPKLAGNISLLTKAVRKALNLAESKERTIRRALSQK